MENSKNGPPTPKVTFAALPDRRRRPEEPPIGEEFQDEGDGYEEDEEDGLFGEEDDVNVFGWDDLSSLGVEPGSPICIPEYNFISQLSPHRRKEMSLFKRDRKSRRASPDDSHREAKRGNVACSPHSHHRRPHHRRHHNSGSKVEPVTSRMGNIAIVQPMRKLSRSEDAYETAVGDSDGVAIFNRARRLSEKYETAECDSEPCGVASFPLDGHAGTLNGHEREDMPAERSGLTVSLNADSVAACSRGRRFSDMYETAECDSEPYYVAHFSVEDQRDTLRERNMGRQGEKASSFSKSSADCDSYDVGDYIETAMTESGVASSIVSSRRRSEVYETADSSVEFPEDFVDEPVCSCQFSEAELAHCMEDVKGCFDVATLVACESAVPLLRAHFHNSKYSRPSTAGIGRVCDVMFVRTRDAVRGGEEVAILHVPRVNNDSTSSGNSTVVNRCPRDANEMGHYSSNSFSNSAGMNCRYELISNHSKNVPQICSRNSILENVDTETGRATSSSPREKCDRERDLATAGELCDACVNAYVTATHSRDSFSLPTKERCAHANEYVPKISPGGELENSYFANSSFLNSSLVNSCNVNSSLLNSSNVNSSLLNTSVVKNSLNDCEGASMRKSPCGCDSVSDANNIPNSSTQPLSDVTNSFAETIAASVQLTDEGEDEEWFSTDERCRSMSFSRYQRECIDFHVKKRVQGESSRDAMLVNPSVCVSDCGGIDVKESRDVDDRSHVAIGRSIMALDSNG